MTAKKETAREKAEKVKTRLREKAPVEKLDWKEGLSTGSTLLNLACSGRPDVGYTKGRYYFFVGDSAAGKSLLANTALAEAANNPAYDEFQLVYDDAEDGNLMNLERMFGKKMAGRIKAPCYCDGVPEHSSSIEEFYFNLDSVLDEGPAIYVLDSMDALTSEEELDHFEGAKDAHSKGKEAKGSFATGKAKRNSAWIRLAKNKVQKTGSILIILAQTRDNIGFGSQFNPRTRSGGRSLKFYSQLELWFKIKKQLTKRVAGAERNIGIISEVETKKNRFTGQLHKVEIPILWDSGVDDLAACVDYMLSEGGWEEKKSGNKLVVEALQLGLTCKKEELIEQIEESGKEEELRDLVTGVWRGIEEASRSNRKKRYE